MVAGDDAGPPARVLAERAGWPLLAEPTQRQPRTGDHALRTYRLLLGGPLGDEVERVVVFGHPTLSRPVMRLMQRDDVEVLSVPRRGAWTERPFPVDAARSSPPEVEAADEPDWLDALARRGPTGRRRPWTRCSRDEADLTPYEVAGAVAARCPPAGCWSSARPARSATST